MKTYLLIAAGAVLAACATPRDSDTAELAAATPATASGSEAELHCVNEPVLGTRLPRRRHCFTEEEWDTIQTRSRDAVREIQNQNVPEDGTFGSTGGHTGPGG